MKNLLFILSVIIVSTDGLFSVKTWREREDFRPRLPFFSNCSKTEIREFFSITKNRTQTKGKLLDATRSWAEKIGNETLELFNEYIDEVEDRKEKASETIKNIFKELPAMFEKFDVIKRDMAISGEEEESRMRELFKEYPESTTSAFIYIVSRHLPRGINECKRKPFISIPRTHSESNNRGPYGRKVNKSEEEEI